MKNSHSQFSLRHIIHLLACSAMMCAGYCAGEEYELDDPAEPWRKVRAGVTDKVMPPYTPLVRTADQVQCWGRSYSLGGLFPNDVTSQDQKLLVRPITLQVCLDGKWQPAESDTIDFSRVAPDRCDYESTTTAGTIHIATESSIEYDGLIRSDLTLSAEQPITVQELRIEFPFAPDAAIFHHLEARWSAEIFERSPSRSGEAVDYPWLPLVWVGNHDVGFTVVTETSSGWTWPAKGAIRIERRADAVMLMLRIITEPLELRAPLKLRFGLMATPAKPMLADRWSITVGKLPGRNVSYLWNNPPEQKYFSYPQPSDFEKTREKIANAHDQGHRVCYYITTSATGIEADVVKRNYADWMMAADILKGDEWKTGSGLVGVGACCPASEISDFLAWGVDQLMTHLDVDGLYIDNPGPYWCYNTHHGCAVNGRRTYPFFALRDLHKRLYTIVKTHKPNGLIWEHTSKTFNPIQLAWIDLYSDGEPWRKAENYPRAKLYRHFTRTYMDITGTGHQVGAVPAYLDSIGVRTDGDWSHWLPSRVLPYGQLNWSWHGWLDGTPAIAVAQARLDFGVGREPMTFYRPHELPDWFSVSGKPNPGDDLLACIWQRKRDNALLVLLSNWADHPIQARLNEKRLAGQLGPCVMFDATTSAEFPGQFMISVPANSFRMVRIERPKE